VIEGDTVDSVNAANLAAIAASLASGSASAALGPAVLDASNHVIRETKRQVEEQCADRGIQMVFHGPEYFGEPVLDLVRRTVLDHLDSAIERIEKAPLPARILAKAMRVREQVTELPFTPEAAKVRLHDFAEDLLAALNEELCLHVPPDKRGFYDAGSNAFGSGVTDSFPDAAADIFGAARCLALDQHTASVFHCMRVLGHGLRRLADRFEVPWEAATWHRVISDIEAKINVLRNADRTSAVRKDVAACSEAASQFRYFKDAWRNYVAHEGPTYDADEAQIIFIHTRDFMRAIAKLVGPASAATTGAA